MRSQLSFTLLLAFALAAAASPVVINENHVGFKFARRSTAVSGKELLQNDQARARHFKSRHTKEKTQVNAASARNATRAKSSASTIGVGVTNGVVSYTAEVLVGNPARTFNLIVDTGSSNTWVGADPENPFVETKSSEDTGQEVLVEYGSGLFFGEEFIDTVSIGSLTITKQSIGAAELSEGFDGVDGIIGLGPTDLTEDTTSGGGTIPTVVDNAFSQGSISSKVLGVSFEPTTSLSVTNGELTFGGTDSTKFTGTLNFVPITTTSPANEFVGIQQTVTYAGKTLLNSVGIADTGTTLLLLATDALGAYTAATGAVQDDQFTGLLQVTEAQFNSLQSLFFTIGSQTYEFTANAQLWPRALNTAIGGQADSFYLIVNDIGTPSGEGLDFIDGQTFLERFYIAFDSGKSQFGIATTKFTNATTN